ncbi:hypothetical protein [Pseudolactococcus insecticola]|uniref:Uncharacterized protein n=1 Tax=Pseudolactococcus insecticola TaxID=2709158 RepID=A0A6A0B853_9LACT|nr:hypothetical protein [Lactococcus insecticola]GFH40534.1 hypothetical protein Hs20B_09320 [Lactococcus insecticola]
MYFVTKMADEVCLDSVILGRLQKDKYLAEVKSKVVAQYGEENVTFVTLSGLYQSLKRIQKLSQRFWYRASVSATSDKYPQATVNVYSDTFY